MNEKFSYGEPVEINHGGTKQLGFVVGGPHNQGGEQKYDVALNGGGVVQAAYTDKSNDLGGGFFTRK